MGSGRETHFGEGVSEPARTALARPLAALVAGAMPHPWTRDQVTEALGNARTILRIAGTPDAEGRPLGFVLGRWLDHDLAEIDLVAVDPPARRQGLARSLLDGFLTEIARAGATECQLELSQENGPAFALYVGAGFVVVGRRERYYPDGADALLLSWRAPEG